MADKKLVLGQQGLETLYKAEYAKESSELVDKLSAVMLHYLLRKKTPKSIEAAHELNEASKYHKKAYECIENLVYATGTMMDEALALDYIYEKLGIKGSRNSISFDGDQALKILEDDYSEYTAPISKMLFGVTRAAYAKMDDNEITVASKKIISTLKKESSMKGFYNQALAMLKAVKKINAKTEEFILKYNYFTNGLNGGDLKSILSKVIGMPNEPLIRAATKIMGEHLKNDPIPSWPSITIEKSEMGKLIGFMMKFEERMSYYSFIYVNPDNMNLFEKFEERIREFINDPVFGAIGTGKGKLSLIVYRDFGVFLLGSDGIYEHDLPSVKEAIRRLFQ
ncbi:MAG: hypothetical protein M1544_01735 [Candidatus Marsarchaeota archaeon]|nr:hypothetical protein [Candidatus Marsarchaeota archaeon]MCL5102057.1 hypothetical protein [Candidatus Marsarchaeota archaeon]